MSFELWEPAKIVAQVELTFNSGTFEIALPKPRGGQVVGTDPLIGRFIGCDSYADIWFSLNKKSQLKVVNDETLKAGFVPDWLLSDYYRGCMHALMSVDDARRDQLIKRLR